MHHGDTPSHTTLQTLGRYRLLQLIGRGGMGEVWLAEDPRLHRQVAIKTLPTHSQEDREFLLRFEREAQAAAALNHPHILPVYDYGDQPVANGQSITYLVMPLVSGGSLSNRISAFHKQQMQIPPQEALQHLMQAAEAIDYAHDQGIIHRDIKPGNMLMRSENWLLLADFGIAHLMSSRENLTRTGESFGTPEYMAPEQARGKPVPSSDNYSLAVIAFYLLAGRLPFKADMPYATTIQHLTMPPPSPRQFNPSLPLAVETILLQGLAKFPAERLPSCRAFVGELQRAMDDSDGSTVIRVHPVPAGQPSALPPQQGPELPDTGAVQADATTVSQADVSDRPTSQPQPTPPASPGIKRRKLLIGGAASLVTVGGGLALWRILSQSHPTPPNRTSSPTPTPTSDPLAPVMILRGHNSPVWNLAFSPAQNSLVLTSTGKEDQFVLLWDIQKFQNQASPSTPIDRYTAKQSFISASPLTCWSRDGKYLAIGQPEPGRSAFDETTMTVYTGDLNAPAPGFTKPVTVPGSNTIQGITWYQDKYVVIGNNISVLTNPNGKNQFQIGVIDTTQTQPQWIATTFDGFLPLSFGNKTNSFPLASSPDGSLLALTDEKTVMVGTLAITGTTLTWQQEQEPLQMDNTSFSNKFSTVIWSPSGDKIGAIYGNTIAVWDWKVGKNAGFTLKLDNKTLTAIAWSPTPSSGLVAGGTDDGTVAIWDTAGKNLIPIKTFNTGKFKALVSTLAWSADGQWLAAGLQDNYGSIAVWAYS
jgi:eukaryotic-like serine/threonine-protein kinase